MAKLQANMILEILGRPQEHVKEALNALVTRLGSENGIKLLEKKHHEPIPVENSKDLFTAFAELTLELESLNNYFGIMFAYMPAHIELIQPEKITLGNIDLNELGNKLLQRLHDYDAITKKALVENEILAKKLQEIAPHLFKQSIQQAPKQEIKTKSKRTKKKK